MRDWSKRTLEPVIMLAPELGDLHNCGSSSFLMTASDLTTSHFLEICFDETITNTRTYVLSPSGSSSEAFGEYTVSGTVVYEIKSGSCTVTKGANNVLTIAFSNAVARTSNNVEATLSFNGTCTL